MKKFFHHLFLPRHTNNFRARVLHTSVLSVIAILFFALAVSVQFVKTNSPSVLGISYSIATQDLLSETNRMRSENGLPALILNEQLSQAAQGKAAHMMQNNYWAHFAPDGTTPWQFIKNSGYEYTYAGENLAKGFTHSNDVVAAWMNSTSHRENLLSQKYDEIGFAVIGGNLEGEETVLVVQMFGSRVDAVKAQPIAQIPEKVEPVQQAEKVQEIEIEKPVPQKVLQEDVVVKQPVIDSQTATKSLGVMLIMFLGAILLIDLLIVERKKIPRIAGHNIDHIILFLLFGLFILLESNASVL